MKRIGLLIVLLVMILTVPAFGATLNQDLEILQRQKQASIDRIGSLYDLIKKEEVKVMQHDGAINYIGLKQNEYKAKMEAQQKAQAEAKEEAKEKANEAEAVSGGVAGEVEVEDLVE